MNIWRKRKTARLTISAVGFSQADIEQALEEALRRIKDGNLRGGDENDTGAFHFFISDSHGVLE